VRLQTILLVTASLWAAAGFPSWPSEAAGGRRALVQAVDGAASGSFRDPRDGEVYSWVRIGSQIWMAENLRFRTASGSWCWQNDESRCRERGRFYDWDTAQRVAPPGWHLASDAEWMTLEHTLGLTPAQTEDHGIDRGGEQNTVAAQLKKPGAWPVEYHGKPIATTNETGFSAVPTGFYGLGEFTHDGYASWWTSSDLGGKAWLRIIRFFDNKVGRDTNPKSIAFSVRCVKDVAPQRRVSR